MIESSLASAHSLVLNDAVYKKLATDKNRPLYLHEWLCYLDKNLPLASKQEIKECQQKIINQLLSLFQAFPGPPLRHLIAKNMATLFSIGDILALHQVIEKCNELLKSKENETQIHRMAKLCALNVLGSLYERLGRMVGTSYEETVQILLKYLKSADSQVRIEIVHTFEKILFGLGSAAGHQIHKSIYKQLKQLALDKVLDVRSSSIKCLCEMIKHSTFLYLPSNMSVSASSASGTQSNTQNIFSSNSSLVSNELETNINLGFKALDGSNYDVRCNVAIYMAQLIYYYINHVQQQQLHLQQQQQLANASVQNLNASNEQQRQQSIQQQQNMNAQLMMNDKIKNTLFLLANGFNKLNQSFYSAASFNLVRGAASSLASNVVNNDSSNTNSEQPARTRLSPAQNASVNGSPAGTSSSGSAPSNSSSQSSQINRDVRIGCTYAYVELANLLGTQWLERNLKLFLTHVLGLVNGTKAVATHLDAVYSRKCVQFILRSIIGGMLNEKVQLQAARELLNIIDKCMQGIDIHNTDTQQQHVLICAIYELSCILKSLNTSASILISDDASLKLVDKILSTLMYPNTAVKCVSSWCLRTLASSLPALLTPLLDNCMDRLSLIRNPSDALVGYGFACAALLGTVNSCPLGIPHLKTKTAFHLGEELICTASQSNNIAFALQKTSIGWLLLGAFMTMGSTIVRKHLPRIKRLWNSTMPSSVDELESEKKRGDVYTWQLSLESRSGALSSIHSFLLNCNDLLNENINSENSHISSILNAIMTTIEGAILLLSQLPNIIKINNNSVAVKAHAATFRLKLYQTLISLPSAQLYESSFAVILRELVAEFTLADQQTSSLVTSTLRSVCHSNDSILFANCWLQDSDYKTIEDQLQPHSASGCEALEHDITYLYQKSATVSSSLLSIPGQSNSNVPGSNMSQSTVSNLSSQYTSNSILNATTIKSLSNASFYSSSLSSLYVTNSNLTHCTAALPLGVSVIDASIQLFGIMYPKVPNKHRLEMLLHFIDCIQRQPTNKANAANKQALQINIFTAVLGALKSLAENKGEIGDESVRKATLKLVMETLCHPNPILRCAAGEALGRMTQVVAESHFVSEVAHFCFEKLRNSQENTSITGYLLGLGCLHRYVGNMGAGQHITSSISILFAKAQSGTSIVQVWAIHALYLITDSGGSMFRNYIEPCVEFIAQSVLSIPYTNRDVFVGLGKLLSSLITFMGPELQMNTPSISDMRMACLTTCTIMQKHSDSMIRAEAIQCLQELHLFAPKYVNLKMLVPYLLNSLVSKEFLLRKVAISCMRQLCQKDSIEVCNIARAYVQETKPVGLIYIISERGLECLLLKMLDIETNPHIIRDLHDIIHSLLCASLNEYTLKHWLFLCKDIAISADESLVGGDNSNNNQKKPNKNKKKVDKRKSRANDKLDNEDNSDNNEDDFDEEDDIDEDDDSQTLQISSNKSSDDYILSPSGAKASNDPLNSTLKLKQITKIISPKWPNKVFAIELIRRIIYMCATNLNPPQNCSSPTSSSNNTTIDSNENHSIDAQKKLAHFDLLLAKRLKQTHQSQPINLKNKTTDEDYLILFLQDLMRIACIGATSSCDPLKLVGLDLLHDLILYFARVEEPNPEFKGHLILEQYQAQVSAALRPQFSIETSAHVTAKACQVCSMWISSGVARDLNDLRRVHQLLVSSLQKLSNSNQQGSSSPNQPPLITISTNINTDHLIYSELSLTVEKLAVLRAWAEVYIVAQKKTVEAKANKSLKMNKSDSVTSQGSESLLSLVQPELAILSYHWSIALKDYAFLCLPSEYASQLPIEGGAFYHADLVESSKPIYKEHFTKILLAYSIWLNEIKFEIKELPANQKLFPPPTETTSQAAPSSPVNNSRLNEQKEKLFFMLLGLSLETLSNTTGLAQLSDETIENILESIDFLLRTTIAKEILVKKALIYVWKFYLFFTIKLTRDLMSINLLVIHIVNKINDLRLVKKEENESQLEETTDSTTDNNNQSSPVKSEHELKREKNTEKNSQALIYVILEICIRDLIKYVPSLLSSSDNKDMNQCDQSKSGILNKSSFLYLHVSTCKQLTPVDVDLLRHVVEVLNKLPFHLNIQLEKRISLISIVYHIQFNLIQSLSALKSSSKPSEIASLNEIIFNSFKQMCSTSSSISNWFDLFKSNDVNEDKKDEELVVNSLIQIQQSALMSTLNLKNVNNCTIMKLLSIFFQYCSIQVFEPLNVYEKCKVFMCSMRCSDSRDELLCMIQSLNEILSNKQTKKEIRIILLKEHLSYLLKLTSSTNQQGNNSCNFLSTSSQEGIRLIKSLLDLLESMVVLMSEQSKEQETLGIFIHILSMYLIDSSNKENTNTNKELNDIVLIKLINLAKQYKQEFKQILEKWPNLKTKIEVAFKSIAPVNPPPANQSQGAGSSNASSSTTKAPRIVLKKFTAN